MRGACVSNRKHGSRLGQRHAPITGPMASLGVLVGVVGGVTMGVTGRLRWAVSLCRTGGAAEIVPTPELQHWIPWAWWPSKQR